MRRKSSPTSNPNVLLIFPPISFSQAPHPAIPALAAYLRRQGIEVACLDANIEFFHHFLTPRNIAGGREHAEERFLELNEKHLKTADEKYEYFFLYSILAFPGDVADSEIALSNTVPYTLARKQKAFELSLFTASAPFFPEYIETQTTINTVKYHPRGNRYSTGDIFRSLGGEGIFSGYFEKILPSAVGGKDFDVVGISVAFDDQLHAAFHCAKAVRRLLPHAHITMGGTYITAGMAQIRERKVFDYVDSLVVEDGEEPLAALVREVASGRPEFRKVPSLIYREGDEICRNPVKPPIPLESLPCPDYLVFPLERYTVAKKDMGMPFRTSRGCYWGRCAYCRTGGTSFCGFEQSSAEQMFKNLLSISESTGVTYFNFADNVTDPPVLNDFSRMLFDSGKQIRWTTSLRLDKSVTMERCINFRKAGCTNLTFGLETINPRLLPLIDKGISLETAQKTLSNAAWAGFLTVAFMMVGLPTETEEEARFYNGKLRELITGGLIEGYIYNPLLLIPGSRYYHDPDRYGIAAISRPEGQDLEGTVADYEAPGMSRKTAWRLSHEFCFSEQSYPMEVRIGGRPCPVRQDIREIAAELQSDYGLL